MLATLVAALALAAGGSSSPERVIEEIVAVVRNPPTSSPRVVTLTKLTEEARIALVSRGATAAATGPLDREALRAALDWLLDQLLVSDDAARLRLGEVSREEVLAELRRFRGQFADADEYERFLAASDLPEEELLVTLGRMVRVQRYLERRVGRTARVDEEEVDAWMRARGAAAEPGPARDAARALLVEEKARAQVRALVAELRGRADVRVLERLREPGEG